MSRVKGFTLLEMLLAITIFAMVSLAAWQMLNTISRTRDVQLEHEQTLHELDYAFLIIKQDIRQLIDRGTRTGNQPAGSSIFFNNAVESTSQSLSFVRAGWHNHEQQLPRSSLQRVYYRQHGNALQRGYGQVLDKPSATSPEYHTLVNDISRLKFLFYYRDKWQDRFDRDTFPQGMAIQFEHKQLGTVERRFLIPSPWGAHGNG